MIEATESVTVKDDAAILKEAKAARDKTCSELCEGILKAGGSMVAHEAKQLKILAEEYSRLKAKAGE